MLIPLLSPSKFERANIINVTGGCAGGLGMRIRSVLVAAVQFVKTLVGELTVGSIVCRVITVAAISFRP